MSHDLLVQMAYYESYLSPVKAELSRTTIKRRKKTNSFKYKLARGAYIWREPITGCIFLFTGRRAYKWVGVGGGGAYNK